MIWDYCLQRLKKELPNEEFTKWILPLQPINEGRSLRLLAPNHYVRDWVRADCLELIRQILREEDSGGGGEYEVAIEIGSVSLEEPLPRLDAEPIAKERSSAAPLGAKARRVPRRTKTSSALNGKPRFKSPTSLNPSHTFESFVKGKSNQLARAASLQVTESPGLTYNPLLIYGGVGLGKTHLMQAIGNRIASRSPDLRVAYLHSERFVADMVQALRHNAIERFKRYYRSLSVLLIDDIQFFAGKEHSQEEFFYTFNALLEDRHQVVLTCDRYPKEVDGLEERLKSRFGSGASVPIEPPELETRVAIIRSKAQFCGLNLPNDVCFFIARRFYSNIREIEGAINRILVSSSMNSEPVTVESAKEILKDLLAVMDRMVTVDNIQKVVAGYFKLRLADLLSKRRNRSLARPRQIAMALAKELTNNSLPEIGDAFGGRDHTTVLHACRKIEQLRKEDPKIEEDYVNLRRTLTP